MIIEQYLQYIQEIRIQILHTSAERSEFGKLYKDTKLTKDHTAYAIKDGKEYIGGMTINKRPKKDIYKRYNLDIEAAISFIYVDPKYRGKKLGQLLLDIPMKEYKRLGLTTNDGYTSKEAKHIYEKNGFKVIHGYNSKIKYWYWSVSNMG